MSGTFDISNLTSSLKGGGTRPSQFLVSIFLPTGLGLAGGSEAAKKFQFSCNATKSPSRRVGRINVDFMGRSIPFAGDVEYETWTTSVYNDEDYLTSNLVEDWVNKINSRKSNVRLAASSNPALYKGTAEVTQFNTKGDPLRVYKLYDIFPLNTAELNNNWSDKNRIHEFGVTWEYSWYDIFGISATGLSASDAT